jgi:hypothetical protein
MKPKKTKKYTTPLSMYKYKPLLPKDRRPCPECRSDNIKIHLRRTEGGVERIALKCKDCGRIFYQNPSIKGKDEIEMLSYKIPFIRPVTDTRIIFISDSHCGHIGGYVPKAYRQDIYPLQEEYSGWVDSIIDKFRPYDILACVGDLVEGKGGKSGGVELLTTDMSKQVDMVEELIADINAPKVYMVTGTDYHVGKEEQWESVLARRVNALACNEEVNIDVNGIIINMKHHTGKSSTPYTTQNASMKDAIWHLLKNNQFDLMVRGHVHEFGCVDKNDRMVMTLCGLQYDSRFGKKICTGNIDYGFTIVDIKANGIITYQTFKKEIPKTPTYIYIK